jgi:hypothetical protein
VYTTGMCECDGEGSDKRDVIGRLASAADSVRRRSRTADPVALRDELIRLRRIVDRIELEFATVAGAFAATEEVEWQGCLSPLHWMRLECGMSAAAASSAIAVGSQADSLSESIAAVEGGRLGFAHLALMAGTARAFQASPTAIPFEEQPLLDQAVSHTLSRFRVDCAHARHAHDAQAFQAEQLRDVDYRTLEVRTGEGGAVFIKGFLDPVGGATCVPHSIRWPPALDVMTIDHAADVMRTRSSNSPGTVWTHRSSLEWAVSVRTFRSPRASTRSSEHLALRLGCSIVPGRSARPRCSGSRAMRA